MHYLLDTNIIIWALTEDERLTKRALAVLRDQEHELYCSVASVWEICIKLSTGKLKVPENFIEMLAVNNIGILPIAPEHASGVRSLPRLHGDPFDRLLVVQAQLEKLTIMTHDKQISSYSVPCFLV